MMANRSPSAVAYAAPAIPQPKTPQNSRSNDTLNTCERMILLVTMCGLPLEMMSDMGVPPTADTKIANNWACIKGSSRGFKRSLVVSRSATVPTKGHIRAITSRDEKKT